MKMRMSAGCRTCFAAAALVSLLTGYGFATAIVGVAVFVDRVLYGGPDEQRLALGALAGATAVGALVSGWLVRRLSLRVVTLVGLGAATAGLALMSTWNAGVAMTSVAGVAITTAGSMCPATSGKYGRSMLA